MDRRDFLKTGVIGLSSFLGGCAEIGVQNRYSPSTYTPQVYGQQRRYIDEENFLPLYRGIQSSSLNEQDKEQAYDALLKDFRASVNEQTLRSYEREWASSPLNREAYTKHFLRRIGPEGYDWFKDKVNYINPSRDDAVFMLRYDNACDR